MYTPIKSINELKKAPEVWAGAFKNSSEFVTWCKVIVKHIKKRQFVELYGNYFVYCNSYIKNVSEVFKRLNLTLQQWIDLMIEYKIIKRNDNLREYI